MTADPSRPSAARVHLSLAANAMMWGAAYPLVKHALEGFPAPIALVLRFGLAAFLVAPFARRRIGDRAAIAWGAALGCIMFAVYALLALSVPRMSPVRAAFLMGTTVVFVQVAETMNRRRVDVTGATGALASVVGVYLLTGSGDEARSMWDLVVLTAALLSALGLGVVHRATRAGDMPVDALTFWQLATLAAVAALWTWATQAGRMPWRFELGPSVALALCAVFASALAQRLQMLYQHHARPSVAAMIFALKPLFAAIMAAIVYREMLTGQALAGGALMLLAAFVPPYLAWRRERVAAP